MRAYFNNNEMGSTNFINRCQRYLQLTCWASKQSVHYISKQINFLYCSVDPFVDWCRAEGIFWKLFVGNLQVCVEKLVSTNGPIRFMVPRGSKIMRQLIGYVCCKIIVNRRVVDHFFVKTASKCAKART